MRAASLLWPRERAVAYIEGLLSTTERKNAWQLAEINGDATPYGIQHLLGRASWQADDLRDALCAYVVAHLGDPDAVLVVDETGFLKKGDRSEAVQRHGRQRKTVRRVCGLRQSLGQAGRALYLPASWRAASGRALRGSLRARTMLSAPLHSVYGDARRLRLWLDGKGV